MEIKLASVLKKALKGKRLTQVAADSGVNKSLLHDWVSSGRKPSGKNMPQLKRLANYLGMSMDEILFRGTVSANCNFHHAASATKVMSTLSVLRN